MEQKVMFKQLDKTGKELCQQFQLGYEAQANNTLTDFLDLLILFIEEKYLKTESPKPPISLPSSKVIIYLWFFSNFSSIFTSKGFMNLALINVILSFKDEAIVLIAFSHICLIQLYK